MLAILEEQKGTDSIASSDAGSEAVVRLIVQCDGAFLLPPGKLITVPHDLAELYGYNDEVDPSQGASVLDAVVVAHQMLLGEEFSADSATSFLDILGKHWLKLAFGKTAYYSAFAIDGEYCCDQESEYKPNRGYRGLGYNQAHLPSGTTLEMFMFSESAGFDFYTYFLHEGRQASKIEAKVGEPVTLNHEALLYGYGGPMTYEDRVARRCLRRLEGWQVTLVDAETGEVSALEGKITGEEGEVELSFDTPGTHFVSAHLITEDDDFDPMDMNKAMPWLEVHVAG